MDYKIAIPSYDRALVLKEKTLSLLLSRDVSPNDIYIFVANKKEYDVYKNTLDENSYKDIVIGKLGISNQRNFIIDYFKEGDKIVFVDDDIIDIKIKKSGKVKSLGNLNDFFIKAFNIIEREKLYLWSVKNMYNPFYKNLMKEEGEIGLVGFSGDLIGIINRKEMKITYTREKGEGEQFELLFKYFKKDGGVLRFNNVVVISTKLTPGGKVSERAGVEERKNDLTKNLEILSIKYPEYIKNIEYQSPSGKRANIVLRNMDNRYIEGAGFNSVSYYKIPPNEKIKQLQIELYNKLEETSIPKIEGKRKDNLRTRGDLLGYNAWTFTLGCGYKRFAGYGEFNTNKKHPELLDLLIKYGNAICPKGFKYTTITINRDMKAKKHIDTGNAGNSVITGLGDFTGGNLLVYQKGKYEMPTEYNLKQHILIFNGAELYHRTTPFEGRRYTLVFYNQKGECEIEGKRMIGTERYIGYDEKIEK